MAATLHHLFRPATTQPANSPLRISWGRDSFRPATSVAAYRSHCRARSGGDDDRPTPHFGLLAGAGSAALFGTTASGVRAQAYPTRDPVRIVTPFPARGAGPDAALRLVSDRLRQGPGPSRSSSTTNLAATASLRWLPSSKGGADGHDLIQLDNTHRHDSPSDVRQAALRCGQRLRTAAHDAAHALLRRRGSRQPVQQHRRYRRGRESSAGQDQLWIVVHRQSGHLVALRLQAMMDIQN